MIYVADKLVKRISFIDASTGNLIRTVNLTSNDEPTNLSRERAFEYIGMSPSMAYSDVNNLLYVAYTDSDKIWIIHGVTGDIVSRIKVTWNST